MTALPDAVSDLEFGGDAGQPLVRGPEWHVGHHGRGEQMSVDLTDSPSMQLAAPHKLDYVGMGDGRQPVHE